MQSYNPALISLSAVWILGVGPSHPLVWLVNVFYSWMTYWNLICTYIYILYKSYLYSIYCFLSAIFRASPLYIHRCLMIFVHRNGITFEVVCPQQPCSKSERPEVSQPPVRSQDGTDEKCPSPKKWFTEPKSENHGRTNELILEIIMASGCIFWFAR